MKVFITLLFFIIFVISEAHSKSFVPNSFSANFEERILKASIGKESKSIGKMDYKFPGNIRYEVTNPNPMLLVVNTTKSWLYTPPFIKGEEGQVTIQKSSNLPITKFLDALKGGLEGNKVFTTKYEGKDLKLTFNPDMQKETSIKMVTLHATKEAKSIETLKEFENIAILKMDGQVSNIKLMEMKEDVSFDAGHFVFSVPEKTRVTTN